MTNRTEQKLTTQEAERKNHSQHTLSRRSFIASMAKAGVATAVLPRTVVGGSGIQPPSDTAVLAAIGVGGVGSGKLARMDSEHIVAIADVDLDYAEDAIDEFPDAEVYQDYRRMFDAHAQELDGVVIATPDHTHAVIAKEAMQRGINVYLEKPLTWSVHEARVLKDLAEQTGLVTQMGNQGHSSDDARLVNEYIQSGAIGTVREVHAWTNRPIWPQGIDLPEVLRRQPQNLNWDLYLGPAPDIPYDPAFHPFSWRGWVPFGTGALGDMGAHLLDHPYWALDLGYPTTVETRSSGFNEHSWPVATTTYFEFPARGNRPAVQLTWYDGGLRPPRPAELSDDEQLNPTGGVLYIGSEGKLIHDTYGANPRLLPEELHEDTPEPPQTYDRIEEEDHEMNFVRAIKGEAMASSPFSYAAPLTEVMLLGIVSLRAGNRRLHWDGEEGRITNISEANQYLHREEREGWEL